MIKMTAKVVEYPTIVRKFRRITVPSRYEIEEGTPIMVKIRVLPTEDQPKEKQEGVR